jgi:hypothetical protein
MFASKKNKLLKKYASVILTKDPDSIGNALGIDWRKIIYPVLLHLLIPLILKIIQKLEVQLLMNISNMKQTISEPQCSYRGGWSHFVSFFIEENEPFPDWKDEDECVIVFGDFITWVADIIKLSEVNIAYSATSKMFQGLLSTLTIAKTQQIISLKKGVP